MSYVQRCKLSKIGSKRGSKIRSHSAKDVAGNKLLSSPSSMILFSGQSHRYDTVLESPFSHGKSQGPCVVKPEFYSRFKYFPCRVSRATVADKCNWENSSLVFSSESCLHLNSMFGIIFWLESKAQYLMKSKVSG